MKGPEISGGLDQHPIAKRIAQAIAVALLGCAVSGCPPDLRKIDPQNIKVADAQTDKATVDQVRQDCFRNCETSGGLISCTDENGFMVVKSSGD